MSESSEKKNAEDEYCRKIVTAILEKYLYQLLRTGLGG